jgi:hypothetical protein
VTTDISASMQVTTRFGAGQKGAPPAGFEPALTAPERAKI